MEIVLRPMQPADWHEVAELIYLGTNSWYQTHGMDPIFTNGPQSALVFCEVYESLDPGCCILAVNNSTGKIVGSCFFHPRETHVSLGIMNVHPNYFGASVARRLLNYVIERAEEIDKPIRLVSSALNLDSYSLYTRAGFVPNQAFQDMWISVPEAGMNQSVVESACVREATEADVSQMADLEFELNHIRREKDYRYFIRNEAGIWHVSVYESLEGHIDGFLVSVQHPGSSMIGPGISRSSEQAVALILAELNQNPGGRPVFLVPVDNKELVQTMYRWGARNCEIHFSQVRGECTRSRGVVMPTFMPETG